MKFAIPSWFRPQFGLVLAVVVIVSATIAASILYYIEHTSALKNEAWDDLSTIADLKVREIVEWRNGRLEDGRLLLRLESVASSTRALIRGKSTGSALVREVLEGIKRTRHASEVGILDARLRLVWSGAGDGFTITAQTAADAQECLKKREVQISDLQRDEANRIYLDILIPVFDEAGGPLAVLMLRHDPRDRLYGLIQTWSSPSRTGETLLVRGEGNRVTFLNELRFRKNTALSLSLPGRGTLPAARAVAGVEGIFEGIDYRGVPVLAFTRRIPGSPWALVAKIDQSESYASISQMARQTAVQAGLLILSLGLAAALLLSRQVRRAGETASNKARRDLEDRVEERTGQLRRLTEYLDRSREAEAKKISEAIHEDIGATLTAVRLRLRTVRDRLSHRGSDEVRHLDVATNLLDDVLHDVRRIAHGLRPSVLDHLGLQAAVESLVEEFEKYTQIGCKVVIQAGDLDAGRNTIEVYRILQEALTNIARHADASLVSIHAWDAGDQFHLEVIDNGKGISEEALHRDSGGLLGIRERALRWGGSVESTAVEPNGTRVHAALPINNSLEKQQGTLVGNA